MAVFPFVGVEKDEVEVTRKGRDDELGIALMDGYLLVQACCLEVFVDKIDDFRVALDGVQMPGGGEAFRQAMGTVAGKGAYFKDLLGAHDATQHG